MKVSVKLYATLRKFAPPDNELGEFFEVEFNGSTISDLIEQFGFAQEIARIVFVNDSQTSDLSSTLRDGDRVVMFPPVGGG
ncbi:MAG: MoaD/ThiS family protein [Candidatus Thorarchaeota archaeon]|jgi:molybdopterin converting factor small subunit|nr:MoaD/ThiS family protein [Candidatus Thorarchaeota archaeon]